MSVVCWDGKIIAADRIAVVGNMKFSSSKIQRLPNRDTVAWTGAASSGLAMLAWWSAGGNPAMFPESQKGPDWSRFIVVTSKGKAFSFENQPIPIPETTRRMAWGAGRDFAMGALEAGSSAIQAVKIASKLCTECGCGVEWFRVR